MPRLFVNALAGFQIQGGLVSFTLQDRGAKPGAEDVVSLVMREGEFAQLVAVLGQHLQAYQAQAGRAPAPRPAAPPPPAAVAPPTGAPLKIRPRSS